MGKKKRQPCHLFQQSGECAFGADCRYEHVPLPERVPDVLPARQEGLAAGADDAVARYFDRWEVSADVHALVPPNGLVVLCAAPGAPALAAGVVGVDFPPAHTGIKVSGKRKRGSATLHADTELCRVRLADGGSAPLLAGIAGPLIEVNDRLAAQPQLLESDPLGAGFLGVVFPKEKALDKATKRWTRLRSRLPAWEDLTCSPAFAAGQAVASRRAASLASSGGSGSGSGGGSGSGSGGAEEGDAAPSPAKAARVEAEPGAA